jgi:hypothetical protein
MTCRHDASFPGRSEFLICEHLLNTFRLMRQEERVRGVSLFGDIRGTVDEFNGGTFL